MAISKGKHILLVEDDTITAVAQTIQLKNIGYVVTNAYSGEKAVSIACESGWIQLILMDIDLGPGIDGTEAAQRILNKRHIPVVFLSSHTEPEIVDRTEKITSYGYVVKNSGITVLDASIKMAFRLFEANHEIRERENRYRSLFNNNHSVMLLFDPHTGQIVDANPSACSYYGYTKEQLTSMNADDLNQLSKEEILKEMEEALYKNRKHFLFKHRLSDGKVRDVEVYSGPIHIQGKELLYSIVHDITEKHAFEVKLKESEERFRGLFNNIKSGVAVYAAVDDGSDFVFKDFNEAAQRIEKVDRASLLNRCIGDVFPGVKKFGLFQVLQRVWKTGISEVLPLTEYKDNRISGWRENYVFRLSSGEVVAVYDDITVMMKTEHELHQTQKLLMAAIDNSPVGVAIADAPDGKLRYVNKTGIMMRGGDYENIVNNIGVEQYVSSWHILDLDQSPLPTEQVPLARALMYGEQNSREFLITHEDGSLRRVLANAAPVFDDEFRVESAVVVFQDITEMKKAESLLHEERDRFGSVLASLDTGLSLLNRDMTVEWANSKIFNLYPGLKIIGSKCHNVYEDSDAICDPCGVSETFQTGEVTQRDKLSKRSGRWLRIVTTPVCDSGGRITHVLEGVTDITKDKELEHSLKERIKELDCLFEITSSFQKYDTLAEIMQSTLGSIQKGWQYPEKTAVRISLNDRAFETENFVETRWVQSAEIMLEGRPCGSVAVAYTEEMPEAEEGPFLKEERLLLNAIAEQLGLMRERMQYKEEYVRLFETLNEGIFLVDDNGIIVKANPASAQILGYASVGELLGRNIFDFWQEPSDRQSMLDKLIANNGELTNYEVIITSKSGAPVDILCNFRIMKGEKGEEIGILGAFRDITSIKKTEYELEQSRKRYKMLFNMSNDFIFVHPLVTPERPGSFAEVSDSVYKKLGYSPEEIAALSPLDIITEPDLDAVPSELSHLVNTNQLLFEKTLVAKSGKEIPVEIHANLFDMDGRQMVLSVARDIERRKKAEKGVRDALSEKKDLLRELQHRAKNSFNIIHSMVEIAAMTSASTQVQTTLEELNVRVQSLALLYDLLYSSDSIRTVELGDYFVKIADALPYNRASISLETSFDKGVIVITKKASSLGIVVTELITNAVKHAFVERQGGCIHFTMKKEGQRIVIHISDNGRGIDSDLDLSQSKSYGVHIVNSIIASLEGEISIENREGVHCSISVPL